MIWHIKQLYLCILTRDAPVHQVGNEIQLTYKGFILQPSGMVIDKMYREAGCTAGLVDRLRYKNDVKDGLQLGYYLDGSIRWEKWYDNGYEYDRRDYEFGERFIEDTSEEGIQAANQGPKGGA